jgi:hypothetical protein
MSKIIIIATFLFAITSVMADVIRIPEQANNIKGGYRSCFTYMYFYYNFYGRIEQPRIRKICRADYDENGILECFYILNVDETVSSINKRKSDKFGNETLDESSDSYGNLVHRYVYNRDEQGREIETIIIRNKSDTTRRWITKYIDKEMTILYHKNKKIYGDTLKTLSIYDDNGNCVEELRYYLIDNYISKNLYRYNINNQKIEYSEYLPECGEILREQYEYNKFGQLIVKVFYNKWSKVTDLSKKEFYDQNGKLVECIWFSNNEPSSKSIITYDNYGNKLKEITYDDKNLITGKVIYEYSK